MYRPQWLQFSWNLKSLPESVPVHQVRSVELRKATPADRAPLWAFLERAYATDLAWGIILKDRLRHLREAVDEGIEDKKVAFWLVEHGKKIIGTTGLLLDAGAPVQLISGICVMEEYRCRGLGTWLLHHSLKELAAAGLEKAAVVTRSNTHAARYLYRKLNSVSTPLDDFPSIQQFA